MMWPFNRKPPPAPVPVPVPVTVLVEQAEAARNERSDTVAAFVQRMRDIGSIEIERDLDSVFHRERRQ